MPLNSAIEQKYLAEVEALSVMLDDFIVGWQSASTEEEQRQVESDALRLFKTLLELDFKLQDLSAGSKHRLRDYSDAYGYYRYLTQVNLAKLRKLTGLFIKYFNSQQIALTQLIGQLKRVRQKRAALALWSENESKFVLADHFLNLDYTDATFTSAATCNVETNQGLLTLPVESTTKIGIKKVTVGSNSNGVSGNSDEAVTTNNLNPAFAVNGNPSNWFEYERLDAGPLRLSLKIELNQSEIINQIEVEPVNLGSAYAYVIEDILFTTSGTETVSIHDLVSNQIDHDAFDVKAAGNDTVWQVSFLPTRAKTLVIKFVQPNAHQVSVSIGNRLTTIRNRWAVGIKTLTINRIAYQAEGGINSVVREVPSGLYAVLPILDLWPRNPDLYDIDFEMSFDGGENWQISDDIDDGIGTELLMDGTQTEIIWRLRMERDTEALANATTFSGDDNPIPNTETILRSVSRNQSPAEVFLTSKPTNGQVYVYQPRLGRRGDRFKQIRLSSGTGTSLSIELPFSPLDFDVDPEEIRVFVNRREYGYSFDNVAVGAGEWSFSTDFRELEFSSDTPAGSDIGMVLDEERMTFDQRPDGYYHRTEIPFDPDKININIRNLPRDGAAETQVLKRDRTILRLGHKNIVSAGFIVTTVSGTVLTEVTTRADLSSTPDTYLVDYKQGIMHLNAPLGAEQARVSFTHLTDTVLAPEQFDVVFDGAKPWGIRIHPDAFHAAEYTDTVSIAPGLRLVLKDATYVARPDLYTSSTTSKTLTYDRIVGGSLRVSSNLLSSSSAPQEVAFIDGRTEFLGLIPMNKEETGDIEADGAGDVVFNLAAGALWHEGLEVLFDNTTVFATLKGSAGSVASSGDYHVSVEGSVIVNVGIGSSLPGGIRMKYYYQDPNFDPRNKFSVDYKRGSLYAYVDLNVDATITYKVACYNMSYDVVGQVQSTKYNRTKNSVSVFTENLASKNSLVKIVWVTKSDEDTLKDLEQFFTPMVSVLGLRFN